MQITIDNVKAIEKTVKTPAMLLIYLKRAEAIKLSTAFKVPIASCNQFYITSNTSTSKYTNVALMPIFALTKAKQSGYKRYVFNATFDFGFETILDITEMVAED